MLCRSIEEGDDDDDDNNNNNNNNDVHWLPLAVLFFIALMLVGL